MGEVTGNARAWFEFLLVAAAVLITVVLVGGVFATIYFIECCQ